MDFRMFRRFALVAMASIGLAACGINSVPTKQEAAQAQWGNVESALQRRADLIPNLVSTVQAAAISEQNILQGVIDTVEGFTYRQQWIDGNDIILEFTGTVDGKGLVGIDKITLGDDGRMVRIEVLMRPLNTLIEFAGRMRDHALAFKKETA